MRPIWPALDSVNHRLPSDPVVMPKGELLAVGMGNSVMTPEGVIRPILPARSVNHRLPSDPVVMPEGELLAVGMGNSVTTPTVEHIETTPFFTLTS